MLLPLAAAKNKRLLRPLTASISIASNAGCETKKTSIHIFGGCSSFAQNPHFVSSRLHLKRKYDLVHVHNVPDFLVFSAWAPKLSGAKIILDVHDILPEFFANKFRKPADGIYVKLLKAVEWLSARFADHVIISNHLWFDRITARSVSPKKCSVFINYVDLDLFNCKRTRNDGKFVMMYHGGLQRHQGLDIAIRAFATVARQKPDAEFHIYGGGNMKPEWEALARELGLKECVLFFDSLSALQIAQVVANADLGIVPKRADSFGNEAYSTKIMEFMSPKSVRPIRPKAEILRIIDLLALHKLNVLQLHLTDDQGWRMEIPRYSGAYRRSGATAQFQRPERGKLVLYPRGCGPDLWRGNVRNVM